MEKSCGKVLWITLWRLWKSPGFPQVFLGFRNFRQFYKSPFFGLKIPRKSIIMILRYRLKNVTQGLKIGSKVQVLSNTAHFGDISPKAARGFL